MADNLPTADQAFPTDAGTSASPPAAPSLKKTQTITPTGAALQPKPTTALPTADQAFGNPNDPMTKPIDSFGIDLNSQRDFLAASSDEERTLVLAKGKKLGLWQGYGNQPVIPGHPEDGLEWFVFQNGKKVAVLNPFGPTTAVAAMWSQPFTSMAMALSALIPEEAIFPSLSRAVAGAAKTGVLEGKGALAITKHVFDRLGNGGVYALIRSGITGAAAAVGTGVDEANKYFSDVWASSTDELKHKIFSSFLMGTGAEFVSRLMSGLFGAPRHGYAPLLDPEHKQTVSSTIGRGMTPGISAATKGKSIIGGWEQAIVENLFGGPLQAKRNLEAMKTEAKKQLMAAGYTAAQADTALTAVMDSVHQRFDRPGVNQDLRDRADQIIGDLKSDVAGKQKALQDDIDARMAALEKMIGSPDPKTQELAQQELIKARQKFGQDADVLYDKVDAIIAGAPEPIVLDMEKARDKAREIWKQLPRDQDGKVVFGGKPQLGGVLMDLMNMTPFVEFGKGQRIRKALYDAGEYKNLTGSLNSKLFNELGDELDKAFETADLSKAQPAAVKALRDADTYWRENIDRFQGLRVDQLMSGRVLLEPEEVANILFKKGMVPEAERFKSLMTPEGWANVTASFWSKMKNEATDQSTGRLDPRMLLNSVRRNMNLLKVAFGDAPAANMLKTAEDNAALNGKLDAADLAPGNFRTKLEEWQAADAALQAKLKDNFINMLMDRSPEQKDAVEFMLADPGRIAHAKAFYGEHSPQWAQIKANAMSTILSRSLTKADNPLKAVFAYGGLTGVLAHFSDAQLVELFGKDHAADLKQLAKDIDLVQSRPGGRRGAGLIALGTILMHPFGHLAAIAQIAATGWLLQSPWFVKWLATGFEEKTAQRLAEYIRVGKMIVMFSVPPLAHYLSGAFNQPADAAKQPDSGLQLGRGVGHL